MNLKKLSNYQIANFKNSDYLELDRYAHHYSLPEELIEKYIDKFNIV